jgi:hypothetical protein
MHKHGGEHKGQAAKAVMTSLKAHPRQRLRGKAFLAKWSAVDWSKQNSELADQTGLSRERIRQIRQLVGAPKSRHHGRMRKSTAALQWAKDNLDKLKGLSAAEVVRKYGLSPYWRGSSLHQFLKPFLRNGNLIRKHQWHLMNFRLPNRDLESIWRLPPKTAAACRRQNQHPQPTWPFYGTYPQFSGRGQLQAYHRAVKTEQRNAAKYFATKAGVYLRRR